MTQSRMPTVYLPPYGGPFYWMSEQSGELARAVKAYLAGREHPQDLALVIDYCRYWIDAPAWRGPMIESLRRRIREVRTRQELSAWLKDAVAEGIDPL